MGTLSINPFVSMRKVKLFWFYQRYVNSVFMSYKGTGMIGVNRWRPGRQVQVTRPDGQCIQVLSEESGSRRAGPAAA